MASRRGFVLVLVVGVMGLLLLAGTALLQVAVQARAATGTLVGLCRARLAAASGMEYAASRLLSAGYPRWADDPGSRGDDWAYREGARVPLERAANVSYSHGEPWTNRAIPPDGSDNDQDGAIDEPAEGDGTFERGEPWLDLDGDGRFSAWSGRVRGGEGARGRRFVLRIEGEDGKLPVNAGHLRAGDLDRGYPADAEYTMPAPNGVPDHRDAEIMYHQGIVHALNNLGAILRPMSEAGAVGGWTRREDAATCGDPFEISWLGHDLISARPAGGYRSWEEVAEALVAARYRPEEIERFRPYIGLGPYEGAPGLGRVHVRYAGDAELPRYVPVNLMTARPEALEAVWRYLAVPCFVGYPAGVEGDLAQADHSRAGVLSYDELREGPQGSHLTLVIHPDEAKALASEASRFRQEGDPSWRLLYERLIREAADVFRRDAADLEPSPRFRWYWTQAKADLAFHAVSQEPTSWPQGFSGALAWASWGIDRRAPGENGLSIESFAGLSDVVHRAVFPERFPSPGWVVRSSWDPTTVLASGPEVPFQRCGSGFWPEGLSLAPPAAFRVECLGECGGTPLSRAEGQLRSDDRIDFSSQEDFENLTQAASLAGRGIRTYDPSPRERREARLDDLGTADPSDDRIYPHVVSVPRANVRGYAQAPASLRKHYLGFSRNLGAITLAPREAGRQGATVYWPFSEDFDGIENALTPPEADGILRPNLECWPETLGFPQVRFPPQVQTLGNPEAEMNAHLVSGFLRGFQCPGIDPLSGPRLEAMSIECWMGTGSELTLYGDIFSTFWLWTERRMEDEPGTYFLFWNSWQTSVWPVFTEPPRGAGAFVRDPEDPEERPASAHHVVATFQREAVGGFTRIRLLIDGRDRDEATGLPWEWEYRAVSGANRNGEMIVTGSEWLRLRGVDEVRLHKRVVGMDEARARYRMGRYVRRGTFTSPLYVLEEPSALTSAMDVELRPAACFEAEDPANPVGSAIRRDAGRPVEADPVKVRIRGYTTAPGDPGHPAMAPGYPVELEGNVLHRITGGAVLRSFDYVVDLDGSSVAGVMNDTPVFEGIWVTRRRAGGGRPWSAWSAR